MSNAVKPENPLAKPGPGSRELAGMPHTVSRKREGFAELAKKYDVSSVAIVKHNMQGPDAPLKNSHILWYLENWWGLKPPNYVFRGGEVIYVPGIKRPRPEPTPKPIIEVPPPDRELGTADFNPEDADALSTRKTTRSTEQSWDTELKEVFLLKVVLYDARADGGIVKARLIDWGVPAGGNAPKTITPVTNWIDPTGPTEPVNGLKGTWASEVEVPSWGWYEVIVDDAEGRRMYRRRVDGAVWCTAYDEEDYSTLYNMMEAHIAPTTLEQAYANQLNPWMYVDNSVGENGDDLLPYSGESWNGIMTVGTGQQMVVAGQVLVESNGKLGLLDWLGGSASLARAKEAEKQIAAIAEKSSTAAEAAAKRANQVAKAAEAARTGSNQAAAAAAQAADGLKAAEKVAANAAQDVASSAAVIEDFKQTLRPFEALEEAIAAAKKEFASSKQAAKAAERASAQIQRAYAFARHGKKSRGAFQMFRAGRRLSVAVRDQTNALIALNRLIGKQKILLKQAGEASPNFVRRCLARAAARHAEEGVRAARIALEVARGKPALRLAQEAADAAATKAVHAEAAAKPHAKAAAELASDAAAHADEAAKASSKVVKLAKMARGIEIVGSLIGIGVAIYETAKGIGSFYSMRRKFRRAIKATGDYVASSEQVAMIESLRMTSDHIRSNYEMDAGMALFDVAGLIPNPFCQAINKVGFVLTLVQLGSDGSKYFNLTDRNFGDWLYMHDGWDINMEALIMAYNAHHDLKREPRRFFEEGVSDTDLYKAHVVHDYECTGMDQAAELATYLQKELQFRLRAHLLYLIDGTNPFVKGKLTDRDLPDYIRSKIMMTGGKVKAEANLNPSLVAGTVGLAPSDTEHDLWYNPKTDDYVIDFQQHFPIDKWSGDAKKFKAWGLKVK